MSYDFSVSIEINMTFFLSLLLWWNTLLDIFFLNDESVLHSWDKLHLILSFSYVAGIDLILFCWGFFFFSFNVRSWDILVCSFFSYIIFVWFWYQNNAGLMSYKVSYFSKYLEKNIWNWYSVFLPYTFGRIHQVSYPSLEFLF